MTELLILYSAGSGTESLNLQFDNRLVPATSPMTGESTTTVVEDNNNPSLTRHKFPAWNANMIRVGLVESLSTTGIFNCCLRVFSRSTVGLDRVTNPPRRARHVVAACGPCLHGLGNHQLTLHTGMTRHRVSLTPAGGYGLGAVGLQPACNKGLLFGAPANQFDRHV